MRVARVVADIVRVFARTQRGLGVLVVALATVHFMASSRSDCANTVYSVQLSLLSGFLWALLEKPKAERQAHGRTQKAAQKGEIEPWGKLIKR